ncbi:MAG: transposase [Thermoplasmatales archaeon]
MDETSPQTTANTQRLWSFRKQEITKNTSKFRANTFCFYSLNGRSVVDFHKNSKKEDIMDFLSLIRKRNPNGRIVVVIDNFKPLHFTETLMKVLELNISIVFFPYSPDLKIELILKILNRISKTFVASELHLKHIVQALFYRFSSTPSFAKSWINKFLGEEFIKCNKLCT